VTRLKGRQEDALPIAKQIAALLKTHGASAVRWGLCHSGPYAGQIFVATIYPDGATYDRAMQALSEQFQRFVAEASKITELQDRSVIISISTYHLRSGVVLLVVYMHIVQMQD
jgi:hypothetical protein